MLQPGSGVFEPAALLSLLSAVMYASSMLMTRKLGVSNFRLADPDKQWWDQEIARFLDAGIDTVVGAPRAPLFRERKRALDWPDIRSALGAATPSVSVWRAPDRTSVITAASPLPDGALLLSVNAREITQQVRTERFRLGVVLAVVTLSFALHRWASACRYPRV